MFRKRKRKNGFPENARKTASGNKAKDSYDAIVIKYLYDTRACKEKMILNAMKTIAQNFGSRKIDFTSGTGPALGLLFDRETRVKDLCKEFSEMPEVLNYYATYK